MPRQPRPPAAALPFMMWSEFALRTGEMLLASAQVIGHRTRRIAGAGPVPNARDQREFARMGLEKVETAQESAWAMGRHLTAANAQLAAEAWKDLCQAGNAWMALAGSSTLEEALARQASLVRKLSRSAGSGSRLSQATARLATQGLTPVHTRATANARRLSRGG